MSEYKVSKRVPQRVLNYRFSVKTKNDPEYIKLKESVEEHNKLQEKREAAGLEPHYLRIRGRGRNPIKSGGHNRYSVKDDNASYFDVYVQRDTDKMHKYRTKSATKKAKGFVAKSVNQIAQLMNPVRVAS